MISNIFFAKKLIGILVLIIFIPMLLTSSVAITDNLVLRILLSIIMLITVSYYANKCFLINRFLLVFLLFETLICLFNYLGYDDKNIILYNSSPPFWFLLIGIAVLSQTLSKEIMF